MGDRLIFTIKHRGECLAYIYQNWGCGDGDELDRLVREASRKYDLDLTRREDAINAVRIAGEGRYGHAVWNFATEDEKDLKFSKAVKRDMEYLEAHREDIIADNQDESGILFYYGTFGDYPDYIYGWCDDAYTMNV